ncbi:MAG: hypothetical protein AAB766_00010, partial [Patescibacteria group bacterium]
MKNIATMFVMTTMLVSLFGAFLVATPAAHATFIQDSLDQLGTVGTAATFAEADQNTLPQTIGRIIKIVLGFLGIVLIVIV